MTSPEAKNQILWKSLHDGKDYGWRPRQERRYQTHKRIREYWNPYLEQLGRETVEGSDKEGPCFSCGEVVFLTRAHIIPRVFGGSDEVGNIHLLCYTCDVAGNTTYTNYDEFNHVDKSASYFEWFEQERTAANAWGWYMFVNDETRSLVEQIHGIQ